jgi:hypothetical protein
MGLPLQITPAVHHYPLVQTFSPAGYWGGLLTVFYQKVAPKGAFWYILFIL